jgi:pyrimidine-nucleoside phosphorylase
LAKEKRLRNVDIIIKKREGEELSREEIEFFIQGFTRGKIPDYQVSAWAMAVLLNGMTPRETKDLTLAMANSGDILDLSTVVPMAVDKHSTGGVGDKTTLVVEPLVAACGLPVGKMSGHGLGFSGGTLDKMESIPGFRTDLTTEEFIEQLGTVEMVLTGQTVDLAPADGKLYALRDVTGTVQSIPLIASSVMSKKIAAGAPAILLDVKVGKGAFMKTFDEARTLAELMVEIARLAGRDAVALLSDMNQPLGFTVGNALELKEAIDTLHGCGPEDFRELCMVAASHLLVLGQVAKDENEGRALAQSALDRGSAWSHFRELVIAQDGDVNYIDDPSLLPQARTVEDVPSPRSGYLTQVHAREVGEVAVTLGAGRKRKDEPIDYAVGVILHHKVGEYVETGQLLFSIHVNDEQLIPESRQQLLDAFAWSEDAVDPLPLIYGVIKPG